jgi:hypothetical protein
MKDEYIICNQNGIPLTMKDAEYLHKEIVCEFPDSLKLSEYKDSETSLKEIFLVYKIKDSEIQIKHREKNSEAFLISAKPLGIKSELENKLPIRLEELKK